MDHAPALDPLQARARTFARLLRALAVATMLVILVPSLIGLFRAYNFGLSVPAILVRAAALWAPAVAYLYAVLAIGRAFGAMGAGALFGESVATGLRRAGIALMIGSVLSAIVSPTALHMIDERGPHIRPDLAYLAIGIVGVALLLLAGIVGKAADLQKRKDLLESELEGFF
jgi:hypothetical protein